MVTALASLPSCPRACPVDDLEGRLGAGVPMEKILLSLNLYVLLDKLLEGIEN